MRSKSASLSGGFCITCLAVASAVTSASRAQGAAITTEPVDTTTGSNFVGAGYASAGYALFSTSSTMTPTSGASETGDPLSYSNTLLEQPSSVGITLSNARSDVGYYLYPYPDFQDPTNPTQQVRGGAAGNNEGSADLFNFAVGNDFPASGVQLAVFEYGDAYADSFTLTQTVGGGASAQVTVGSGSGADGIEYFLFDITGASNGNKFVLSGTEGSQDHTLIAGLGIAPLPEPASLAIMGLATMGLLVRRRTSN
jgi:hypothetical protein